MATQAILEKDATATSGESIAVDMLAAAPFKYDEKRTTHLRLVAVPATSANGYNTNANTVLGLPVTGWTVGFQMKDGTTLYWRFATQAARDTAFTTAVTKLVVT